MSEPNRDLDMPAECNAADAAVINTPIAKFVADCAALPRSKGRLTAGDIFLLLKGEDRRLGIITAIGAKDRYGHWSIDIVYEHGERETISDESTDMVFVLGTIPDYARGANPLRTLLNWAARFGG